MKRFSAAVAALAIAGLGTFAVASPAGAAETDPHYATGEWQLRDWEGPYPDVDTSPATLSEASCEEVVLTKPDVPSDGTALYGPSPDGDIGTSYENTDLGLAVAAGDIIAVEYELSSVDNAAAGAVRMFAYDTADADTLNAAPTFGPAIAPTTGTTGTLTLTFAAAGTVGTFGLAYDASNDTEGTVTFSGLRLVKADKSELQISLCAKPEPPAATTTTTTTTSGALANTGSNLTAVLAVAAVLVLGGATVLILARRRRA